MRRGVWTFLGLSKRLCRKISANSSFLSLGIVFILGNKIRFLTSKCFYLSINKYSVQICKFLKMNTVNKAYVIFNFLISFITSHNFQFDNNPSPVSLRHSPFLGGKRQI